MTKIYKVDFPQMFHGRGFYSIMSSVMAHVEYAHVNKWEPYIGNIRSWDYHDDNFDKMWDQYFKNPTIDDESEIIPIVPEIIKKHISTNSPNNNFDYLKNFRPIYKKYIHYNEDIQEVVDKSNATLQGKKTLGVHYRGLDKFKRECETISLERYNDVIKKEAKDGGFEQVLICTDTDQASEFFENNRNNYDFDLIISDGFKSKEGNNWASHVIEKDVISMFDRGKEAIIDCELLGQCETIIKHRSNLSSFSVIVSDIPKKVVFLK